MLAEGTTVAHSGNTTAMPTTPRLAAAIAVLAAAGLVGGGCSTDKNEAANDVKLTSCSPGDKPDASGTVTNNSSKASSYTIRVWFDDAAGNRVSTGIAALRRVAAGKTAQWHVTGVTGAKGKIDCTVAGVTRTVAP